MKVTIRKHRDPDTKMMWYDIYFNGVFQLSCWNRKQVKSYINICKECNYSFCNA